MALTAAELQARITALQKARDAGVLSVRHGADMVQYASFDQISKTLANLQAQLDAVNGVTPRPRTNFLRQDTKGFGHVPNNPFDDWT